MEKMLYLLTLKESNKRISARIYSDLLQNLQIAHPLRIEDLVMEPNVFFVKKFTQFLMFIKIWVNFKQYFAQEYLLSSQHLNTIFKEISKLLCSLTDTYVLER